MPIELSNVTLMVRDGKPVGVAVHHGDRCLTPAEIEHLVEAIQERYPGFDCRVLEANLAMDSVADAENSA